MSKQDVFYNQDGKPCTLYTLVTTEPDWAVSRIKEDRFRLHEKDEEILRLDVAMEERDDAIRELSAEVERYRAVVDDMSNHIRYLNNKLARSLHALEWSARILERTANDTLEGRNAARLARECLAEEGELS